MKLSKQKETEIIKAYKVYFDSYINGDIKTIVSLLDDDYNQIGSAETEVFFNKKDAAKFLHDTIEQIAGRTDIRNRSIKVDPLEGLILVTDLFDIYALMDSEWSFYAKFRASTLMQKKDDGWKFIHQHSSMPDTRTEEGDNIAIEKVNAENLQLREAVKRRTVELEAKNNELKIESSLERIRASAMSMQKAEGLLDVLEILNTELKILGFMDIRNTIINIFNDTKEHFLNYDYSDYGVGGINEVDYNSHPSNIELVNKMRETSKEFMITEFTGNELDEWRKWRIDQGQMPDTKLDQAKSLYYYEYSIGVGTIGISTFSPIKAEQLEILNKIRNVFGLAYRRYADIVQAEAHAREAKVEVALERVRARTMAMQHSDELPEAANVLFNEVQALGINAWSCGYNILAKDKKSCTGVMSSEGVIQAPFQLPFTEHESLTPWMEVIENGVDFYIQELKGKAIEEHYKYLLALPGIDKTVEGIKEAGIPFPSYQINHLSFFTHGFLLFITYEPVPDAHDIFKRFTAVFDQTYTRFLDLKHAEAQARESQIELGLERVRARAMAMQKSEELSDLVNTVFRELTKLDFALSWCIINIIDEPNKSNVVWGANTEAGKPPESYFMKFEDHRFHHEMMKAYQKRNEKWVIVLEGEEKRNYDNYLFTDTEFRKVSKKVQKEMRSTERYVASFTFSNFGGLQTIGEEPLSDDNLNILKRFGKVFDLTYTRFNDLQKAEAQAREAQIELSLERVRARAMAIHKSTELAEVIQIIFEELNTLGIDLMECSIVTYDTDTKGKGLVYWSTGPFGSATPSSVKLQYFDHPILEDLFNDLESGIQYRSGEFSGELLKTWWDRVFTETDFKYAPKDFIKSWKKIKHCFYSQAVMNHGFLEFLGATPLPDEKAEILKRFTNVVDLTYTRFDDVVKAEAQAREAQIEAALEKVRSRSLAMHKPEELKEVVGVVAEKLQELDVIIDAGGVIICTYFPDNKDVIHWIAETDFSNSGKYLIPYFDDLTFNDAWNSKESGEAFFTKTYNKEEKNNFFNYAFEHTGYKNFPDDFKQFVLKSEKIVLSFAWAKNSAIMLPSHTGIVPSDNHIAILKRFANVFEQAYIRFLDLQKAEAQAREAQIEAALERVRSRSIGMQKSDELREVIQIIHDQLIHLDFKIDAAGFTMDYFQNNDWNVWIANKNQSLPSQIYIPYIDHPQFNYYKKAKEKGLDFFSNTLSFEDKNSIFSYMFDFMGEYPEAEKEQVLNAPGLAISQAFLKNITLWIYNLEGRPYSEKDNAILMRFAKVSEQTYVRFNDLKKAEAQANEAKIELSLERIRAKVTAMSESTELLDIVVKMRAEFVSLGHEAHFFWYMRWLPNKYEKAMTSGDGSKIGMIMQLPRHIHGDIKLVDDWEKSDEPTVVFPMDVETAVAYVEKMITLGDFVQVDPNAPTLDDVRHIGGLTFIMARTHHGEIGFSLPGSVPDPPQESVNTLARFASVFDLAYSRFEDLKDAERSNRETQIELALERVRASAMSMHKTSELQDVINTVHKQFKSLEMDITGGAFIAINEEIKKELRCWGAGGTTDYVQRVHIPFLNRPIYTDFVKGLKKGPGFFSEEYSAEEKLEFFNHLFKNPPYNKAPAKQKKEVFEREGGYARSSVVSKYTSIFIINHHGRNFSDADNKILKRFGKVFEQSYTRFLDLQKAEEQAREAQIEASLERIRSRALSMHNSSEVGDVNDVLFDEFEKMGIEMVGCGISVINEETDQCEQWRARKIAAVNSFEPYSYKESIRVLSEYLPDFTPEFLQAWNEDDLFLIKYLEGKERDAYLMAVASIFKYSKSQQKEVLAAYPKSFNATFVFYKRGWLSLSTLNQLTDEEINFSRRFVEAFDFAHTRFLDLQKAESQAREAQIEASLERVRSKTMAMHNSHDMGVTVETLFEQVLKLELDNDIRCGIGILEGTEGTERMETRSATLDAKGEVDLRMGMLDMNIDPMLKRIKKAWKSGGTHYKDQMAGKDVVKYYTALNNEPDYPFYVDLDTLPKKQYHNSFSFSEGILFAFSPNPMTDEAAKVMDRFARVFGQTYTRFVDLLKAEAQAREAQIEAALERIRTQAMAMQHSDDLINSTAILFEELEKLELPLERCGIGIFDKETRDCQLYTTVVNDEGKTELATGITSLTVHPMLIKTFDAWIVQESLLYVLEGKELEDYYKLVSKSKFHLPKDVIDKSTSLAKEHYFYTPFSAGGLYVFSDIEPTEEEIKVIRRFAEVFHMTYTRFEDLQKAEARALEAVKQASLDRVRGEIASMRTSEDLNRITPLIWSELEILEVPFIRCGAFMIDESTSSVQAHLTTSDGKPIGALNLAFDANDLTFNTVEHWRKKKVYTHHWSKEDFINWMKSMASLGQIKTPEQYQGSEKPPEKLDLHFIPFKQGMLYVGNTAPLVPEKIELVKTLAKAFSIAYSRYEDFVNLEEAKIRVEKTLNELKSAQTQLIHSEKMASLGELTAGIAHEIQNPLNFVNNFSDVSVDLIEEMDEEMTLGNNEEVKDIASDLKQNLEKIHHHGKRASFIVQGMLEHSRTNPGDKKPTDINVLADEFLRLSYHGLRAKDKSFNAEMITEFDKDLPEIRVIPQDFGRVLLNLVNNAFYACAERSRSAVAEKQKTQNEAFKPKVTMSTKKLGENVEIRVKDNGDGIPEKVVKKIFQPFFTTKPTGEGTGLGLSMSYDIITKGHSGKLEVETREGEGTIFIISIPIKS